MEDKLYRAPAESVEGIVPPREALSAAGWRETDLMAPSDEELEQYAENVRPPIDYYAE